MRIALACQTVFPGNIQRNINTVLSCLNALEDSADLIVFGEGFLQGLSLTGDPEKDRSAAIMQSDPCLKSIAHTAGVHRIGVSFGYLERSEGRVYSSQIVISPDGDIVHNFRRISPGWRPDGAPADAYACGERFETFDFLGKRLMMVLGGDPWEENFRAYVDRLRPDAILWPVHSNVNPTAWNTSFKFEYGQRASAAGRQTLLVNALEELPSHTRGGAAFFQNDRIRLELAAGEQGYLFANL